MAHAQAEKHIQPCVAPGAPRERMAWAAQQRKVGEVDGREQLVQAWSSVGCTFVVQQATLYVKQRCGLMSC